MGWVQFRAERESNSKFNCDGKFNNNCNGKFNDNSNCDDNSDCDDNGKFNGDGEPGGVEGGCGLGRWSLRE
jgi:hypothetical protein